MSRIAGPQDSPLFNYLQSIQQPSPNPLLSQDPDTEARAGWGRPVYRPMSVRSSRISGYGRGGMMGPTIQQAAERSPEGRQMTKAQMEQKLEGRTGQYTEQGQDMPVGSESPENPHRGANLNALLPPQNLAGVLGTNPAQMQGGWTHPQTGEQHAEGTILHSPSTGQTFQIKNGQPERYGPPQETVTPEQQQANVHQYIQQLAQTDPGKAAELAIKQQELDLKRFEANSKAYPIGEKGSASYDAEQAAVEKEKPVKGRKDDALDKLMDKAAADLLNQPE